MQEWDERLSADLAAAVDIVPEKVIDHERERVVPKVPFDDSLFTRRELALMQTLVTRYGKDFAKPMVNVTHEERGPWSAIWDGGHGNNQRIPYTLAVAENAPNRDVILEAAREYDSITAAQRSQH